MRGVCDDEAFCFVLPGKDRVVLARAPYRSQRYIVRTMQSDASDTHFYYIRIEGFSQKWYLLSHHVIASVFCEAIPKFAMWRLLRRHKTPPRNDRVSSYQK
jgi:hypothetical protein